MFLLLTLFALTQATSKYLEGTQDALTHIILLDTEFTVGDTVSKIQYVVEKDENGIEKDPKIQLCVKDSEGKFPCEDTSATELGYDKLSVISDLPDHIAYEYLENEGKLPIIVLYKNVCSEKTAPTDPSIQTKRQRKQDGETKVYFKYTIETGEQQKLKYQEYLDDKCETDSLKSDEYDCGNEGVTCSVYTPTPYDSKPTPDDNQNTINGTTNNTTNPDATKPTPDDNQNSNNGTTNNTTNPDASKPSTKDDSSDSNGTLLTTILVALMLVVFFI